MTEQQRIHEEAGADQWAEMTVERYVELVLESLGIGGNIAEYGATWFSGIKSLDGTTHVVRGNGKLPIERERVR